VYIVSLVSFCSFYCSCCCLTVSQKKVPTSELSVTLSNLNRFSKFLHCWKVYEICYKTHRTIPTSPYIYYYTTFGNKKVYFLQIFSRYGRKCKQILIYLVFKIWSLSPYRLQIKFFLSLFFYLFIIVINLLHQNFVTADVIAVFVNRQLGISDEDKILIKSLYLKRYTTKRLTDRFSEKKLDKTWC